jgi:hypothetical protein
MRFEFNIRIINIEKIHLASYNTCFSPIFVILIYKTTYFYSIMLLIIVEDGRFVGKKIAKSILLFIIDVAIPCFLSYACFSDTFIEQLVTYGIIGANVNIQLLKTVLLWLSFSWIILILGIQLLCSRIRFEQMASQRDSLLRMHKEVFTKALSHEVGREYCNINIRIFVPRITVPMRFKKLFRKEHKVEFIIKNIPTLADAGMTEGLVFEVSPVPQGVVGICYSQKSIIFDDKLAITNSTDTYKLNNFQIDKTSDLRLIICVPILSKNEDVIAIIAFDSRHEITVADENKNKLSTSLLLFTRYLYDSIPELFRPKGVVL